jgi:S-DNA-T family DNA segregation ATPase FtsK/SpoIIIE
LVTQQGKASASSLQRYLKIGFNRAARIIDQMTEMGIVAPGSGSKPREVLVSGVEDVFGGKGSGDEL